MVRPLERMTERRQIRRAAVEALEEMPTDPRLPIIVLPAEVEDPTLAVPPDEEQARGELPPGFGGPPRTDDPDRYPGSYTQTFTTLTFRVRPEPWYRSNAFKLAIVGLLLLAAVVSVVVLLWPSSSPAPRDTAPTAPAPSPSAAPSATPSPSATAPPSLPPPVELPPPPPPPPPSESAAPPPVYYPPYYGPTEPARKPRIDVTRTPISVSPTVKPKPDKNSSTPGDKKGGGGWW